MSPHQSSFHIPHQQNCWFYTLKFILNLTTSVHLLSSAFIQAIIIFSLDSYFILLPLVSVLVSIKLYFTCGQKDPFKV